MIPPGWPEGWGLRDLDEVGSTMAEAARIAPGLAGPEWILARRQTAGRARRGRSWLMPEGNLAATLVLPVTGGPAAAALRSFTAALALFDATAAVTRRPDALALKWPNDLLIRGSKFAGILLESLPGGWLAVGFGVNLHAAPPPGAVEPGALRPVSLRESFGTAPEPLAFLVLLAQSVDRWERSLATSGFGPARTAWLGRAARLGQEISIRTGSATLAGRFETIDESGHLILATPSGTRAVAAGEVYF